MARKTHKSPEEARTAILDAAIKIVAEVGPSGLRISAVAKLARMAHPNVMHHFGSREGLLNALGQRLSDNARDRVSSAIAEVLVAAPEDRVDALTHVLDVSYSGVEGRAAVWLHMSGFDTLMRQNLTQIVELSHQMRETVTERASYAHTNRLVMLVTMALVGEVVSGAGVKESLGFTDQDENRANFRRWLAEILLNLSDSDLDTSLDVAELANANTQN